MKRLFLILISTFLIGGQLAIADTDGNESIQETLKKLQEQVTKQQQQIEALQRQLFRQTSEQETEETMTDDEPVQDVPPPIVNEPPPADEHEGFAAIKDVSGIVLGKGISGLSIKGDVRFRYERQEREIGLLPEETRDRQRLRLRIGGVWTNFEDSWEFGFGVSSGGAESSSANDTFSDDDVFGRGDLRIDYAYVRHSHERVDVVVGQMISPWKDTTTFMLWDSDVRPVGIVGSADIEGIFVNGGVFDVFHEDARDQANTLMVAAQGGIRLADDDMEIVVAAGYWHLNGSANDAIDKIYFPGGAVTPNDDLEFRIGDIYAHALMNVEESELKVYGHYAKNFGADGGIGNSQLGPATLLDPDDNDEAWLFGGEAGMGPLSLEIVYAHIESDSVFRDFKDSDFGGTAGLLDTDVEGFLFGVNYKFAKTMSLGGTYMDLESIDDVTNRDAQLFQLDLVYKF